MHQKLATLIVTRNMCIFVYGDLTSLDFAVYSHRFHKNYTVVLGKIL